MPMLRSGVLSRLQNLFSKGSLMHVNCADEGNPRASGLPRAAFFEIP